MTVSPKGLSGGFNQLLLPSLDQPPQSPVVLILWQSSNLSSLSNVGCTWWTVSFMKAGLQFACCWILTVNMCLHLQGAQSRLNTWHYCQVQGPNGQQPAGSKVEGQSRGRSWVPGQGRGEAGAGHQGLWEGAPRGPGLGITGIREWGRDQGQRQAGGNIMIQGKAGFVGGV